MISSFFCSKICIASRKSPSAGWGNTGYHELLELVCTELNHASSALSHAIQKKKKKKNNLISWSSFRLTAKLSRKDRAFPQKHSLCHYQHPPTILITKVHSSRWCLLYGFDKRTKTHTHYYSITRGGFTALEILCGEQRSKSPLIHEGRRGTCRGGHGQEPQS